MNHPLVHLPKQSQFLAVPDAPVSYWLQNSLLEAIAAKKQGTPLISEGLGTRDEVRFVAYSWEHKHVVDRRRLCEKGGGYCRWYGHQHWTVEWGYAAARVKAYISETYPPEIYTLLVRHEYLFDDDCLVYSTASRGSLGVRISAPDVISGDTGPSLFVRGYDRYELMAFLNGRINSYILRGLTAGGINFKPYYLTLLPMHYCRQNSDLYKRLATHIVPLKQAVVDSNAPRRAT